MGSCVLVADGTTALFAGPDVVDRNNKDEKLPTTMTKQQSTEVNGIGSELEKYLYHDDPSAVPVLEYTDARQADFFATNQRRVLVQFYSPYCVRGLLACISITTEKRGSCVCVCVFCYTFRRNERRAMLTFLFVCLFVDFFFFPFFLFTLSHLSSIQSTFTNKKKQINRDIAACFVRNM